MPRRSLSELWKSEFTGYTLDKFRQDLLAGLTVAAVALPLALAFGVASGATAAAGMVTAILAGVVIGGLSGAPYQISGPTGAMSAVLILLAQKYGLPGIWVAGVMAGALMLVIGLLRLGRFIAYIPAPVITGFTSGIALIIAIGQLDNLLGVKTPGTDSAASKLIGYIKGGFIPDWRSVALGGVVILTMILWPKKWNARFPASLLGILLATLLNVLLNWPVNVIGAIPQTLLLGDRLTLAAIPWANLQEFVAPTLTIAALGAVESLLCGAVASNMTGIRLQTNAEISAAGEDPSPPKRLDVAQLADWASEFPEARLLTSITTPGAPPTLTPTFTPTATLTPTPTRTPTRTPTLTATPFAGVGRWSGTTSQGWTIRFDVTADGTIANLGITFPEIPCTAGYTLVRATISDEIPIAEDEFSYSDGVIEVAGQFDSPATASGAFGFNATAVIRDSDGSLGVCDSAIVRSGTCEARGP